MKLVGDEKGIQALKEIKSSRPSFLKFIISEAQSNTTHTAQFKDEAGIPYTLRFDPKTGNLEVLPES